MWLVSDLLSDVRRRGMLPATQSLGFTDADLIAHANNEMASHMVPLVLSVNEEFYVQTVNIPLVAGKAAYRMPNRNAGAKLRDVTYIIGGQLQPLFRIEPEQLSSWVSGASGSPQGFYLEAGTLNLVPAPSAGGTLRMRYFVRPGAFTVTATDFGTVASVTTNTVDSMGVGVFSGTYTGSLTAGSLIFDVIAYRPPFEYLALNAEAFTFSAPNINLVANGSTQSMSPNIAVGDYIAKPDLSPVLQLPVELHSLLSQRVVCAVMEALNYGDRLARAREAAAEMEAAALKLITPRIDSAPKKMRGLLNQNPGYWPRWR